MGPRVTPLWVTWGARDCFPQPRPYLTSPKPCVPVITVSEFTVPPSEWDAHRQLEWRVGGREQV